MQNNIKAAIVILAVIASASAWQFLHTVGGLQSLRSAITFTSPLPAPNSDIDNDGLTNEEESYWNTDPQDPDTDSDGFKDGEEVVSGHDPLIPGPDDVLPNDNEPQNITKKVSLLVLSGLYEGSLKPKSPSYQESGEQIVNEIIRQSQINSAVRETVPPPHTVASSPEAAMRYARDVSPILKTIAADIPKQFPDIAKKIGTQEFMPLLNGQIARIDKYVSALQALTIPEDWSSSHTTLVLTLGKIRRNFELLQNSKEDPLQMLTSTAALVNFIFTDLTEILSKYSSIYVQ